jgi:hypothetical protein
MTNHPINGQLTGVRIPKDVTAGRSAPIKQIGQAVIMIALKVANRAAAALLMGHVTTTRLEMSEPEITVTAVLLNIVKTKTAMDLR